MLNRKGVSWDLRLYLQKLDLDLEKIIFPITFYHGELDRNMPIKTVRQMIAKMPNAKLIAFGHEADLSTFCNHFIEAAEQLLVGKEKAKSTSS